MTSLPHCWDSPKFAVIATNRLIFGELELSAESLINEFLCKRYAWFFFLSLYPMI